MTLPSIRQLPAIALFGLGALGGFGGCSGAAEEGEACDRANGDEDCADGLICRGEWEVRANESVCCPRPPAKPGVDACKPQIEHVEPNPSIDASYGAGGSGGGSAGSGGSAATGGLLVDSGGDALDAAPDAVDAAELDSAPDTGD